MERVIAYIDGFNLYYGLKSKGWKRFYWLDLKSLSANLLKNSQQLVEIKYFTSRISSGDIKKRKRQTIFLDALTTLDNFKIYYGHYLEKRVTCFNCNNTWNTHEEKMTDVCMGTEMLLDAFNDRFDSAILISGDSDLVPPVNAVHRQFHGKKVIVAFPPGRFSANLQQSAYASFPIRKSKFRKSMFPDQVTKPDGYVLTRPREWRKNIKP